MFRFFLRPRWSGTRTRATVCRNPTRATRRNPSWRNAIPTTSVKSGLCVANSSGKPANIRIDSKRKISTQYLLIYLIIILINCLLREIFECTNERKEEKRTKYYNQWRRNCSVSRLISDRDVHRRNNRHELRRNSAWEENRLSFEREIGQEIVANSFDPIGFNYQW